MFRIIAVCPTEYPGVSSVLRHGEKLGLWKQVDILHALPDNDLVILGAWHPCYNEFLERYNCVVYLTSTFGQMEFSSGMIELEYIKEIADLVNEHKIKAILAGWNDVAAYFSNVTKEKALYCPYPFFEEPMAKVEKEPNSLGIFLPFAPRKNTFNQLLAASHSGMKVYTNLPYAFGNVERVGWLNDNEYKNMISKLIITLHCTFTESFSYAAAESLLWGTLPIVSVQIAENLGLSGERLICYQCDSVNEIYEKIIGLKNLEPEAYKRYLEVQQAHLKYRIKKNLAITKDVLDKVVELVVK